MPEERAQRVSTEASGRHHLEQSIENLSQREAAGWNRST